MALINGDLSQEEIRRVFQKETFEHSLKSSRGQKKISNKRNNNTSTIK